MSTVATKTRRKSAKKQKESVETETPPERGGIDANPTEEYFDHLNLVRLHIRLPRQDHERLLKLAGGPRRLRAYISGLIGEAWRKR